MGQQGGRKGTRELGLGFISPQGTRAGTPEEERKHVVGKQAGEEGFLVKRDILVHTVCNRRVRCG